MGTITEISNTFVERIADADPVRASRVMGLRRDVGVLTDYSPEGDQAIADVHRSTLRSLDAAPPPADDAERLGSVYLRRMCTTSLALIESGERGRTLSALSGPPAMIRMSFDVMPRDDDAAWGVIAERLTAVEHSLEGYRRSLWTAAQEGRVPAIRQVRAVAEQCATWADGWFTTFASGATGPQAASVEAAATRASSAYGRLAEWLRSELAALAVEEDGVGEERYTVSAAFMLGADIDLDEAYEWGRHEWQRLDDERRAVARQILPGATVEEAIAHLETDEADIVVGVDAYRAALQAMLDEAIDQLDQVEFDIDPRIRRCVVGIPPAGTSLAPYYSPPTEDLSQPGTTWFPTQGEDRFPMWDQRTTVYHEAVPGHHLQLGLLRILPLTRAQNVGTNTAHAEGWALYAERLMDELGYFANPGDRLGFLSMQAFRAARVVVDIGLHTGRDGWTFERAVEAMASAGGKGEAYARNEVERYLSWPAQAPTYKLGERSWLAGRQAAMDRLGPSFDRKRWHSAALALGGLGLDDLEPELRALA